MANRDFIRTFFRKAENEKLFDAYHFFLPTPNDVRALKEKLENEFPGLHKEGRFLVRTQRELPQALAKTDYFCFHLSDPFAFYSKVIRLRNRYGKTIFPVTAPTHSLSYKEYGNSFLQHMWEGVSRRDAVVATSRCGRDVVAAFYSMLRANYGLDPTRFPSPQVPVVPLGVSHHLFPSPAEREGSDSLRAKARKEFGIAKEQVVFLTLARISYQSKMDLLPLLHAFKRAEAAGLSPQRYLFLLAGWESEGSHFSDDVRNFCAALGVPCAIRLRPDDDARKKLYAAGDVFVSPADNFQETFGLTMLEAAASSLPVVASDFDGYKDLVLEGATGFLTPTLGPADTADSNLRAEVSSSSEHHLRLAQQCVVDVKALGLALARTGTDEELRRSMGEAARRHARAYAWESIVDRYTALWAELAATPLSPEEEKRLRASSHPCQVDYGGVFGGYCSTTTDVAASEGRMLQWSKRGEAVYRGKDFPVIYKILEDDLPFESLKKLLFAARKPLAFAEALRVCETLRQENNAGGDAAFLLLWALKHDMLEFLDE